MFLWNKTQGHTQIYDVIVFNVLLCMMSKRSLNFQNAYIWVFIFMDWNNFEN
jgi:hypothetical protein